MPEVDVSARGRQRAVDSEQVQMFLGLWHIDFKYAQTNLGPLEFSASSGEERRDKEPPYASVYKASKLFRDITWALFSRQPPARIELKTNQVPPRVIASMNLVWTEDTMASAVADYHDHKHQFPTAVVADSVRIICKVKENEPGTPNYYGHYLDPKGDLFSIRHFQGAVSQTRHASGSGSRQLASSGL